MRLLRASMKYVILTLFFAISFDLAAQYDEEVTVMGEYEPILSDAYKINMNPKIVDTIVEKPALYYAITPRLVYADFELEPIKAARVRTQKLSKLYKNYVKLGFGNYATPYFDFYANSSRNKDAQLGLNVYHHSSAGKIKDYAFPGFSKNKMALFGKKIYKRSALGGNISYTRKVHHFYGYKPDELNLDLAKDDYKQRYNLIEAGFNYHSTFTDSNHLNHAFLFDYYFLGDKFESMEHGLQLNAAIDKQMDIIDITDKQSLGLMTELQFFANQDSSSNATAALVEFQPYLKTAFNEYELLIGARVVIAADSVSDFHLFPHAMFRIHIVKEVFNAFAGLTGEVKRNSFRSLSEENPFVKTQPGMSFAVNTFKFYGGLSTRIGSNLDISAQVSSSSIDNMAFFINDTNSIALNEFAVMYDDLNLVDLLIELVYSKEKRYFFAMRANFYQYIMSEQKQAWHKPDYRFWVSAGYNLADKILLKANVFAMGQSHAKTFDVNNVVVVKDIKSYVDFNLELEYRYTDILSAFLKMGNLNAGKYFHWYNYPAHRFQVMGGVTYSF